MARKRIKPMWGRHPYRPWVAKKITPRRTAFRYFGTRKKAQLECDKWVQKMIGKRKTSKCIVEKRPTW